MIGVDVTPLALGPQRGVTRALAVLLQAWAEHPPPLPLLLFSPRDLPADVEARMPGEIVTPRRACRSARAFRAHLPRCVPAHDLRVFLSPWSAFPRLQVPVVAWVHELPFVRLGPIEGRLRTWRHRVWLRRNVAKCAAIVVPSRATRSDLLSVAPAAAPRVTVIHHGFDPAPWEQAARAVPRASPPRIVMVGCGPGPWGPRKKGVDVLVEAAAHPALRVGDVEVHVDVIGDPGRSLPPSFTVHRDPEDDALRRLVARATVLVHPARSEGFGFPPLEAMAAGTPVVCVRAGALPEVVGDGALLVEPGDPDALAVAVRHVLDSHDLRATLEARGRLRVRDFAPAPLAARFADVLRHAGGVA